MNSYDATQQFLLSDGSRSRTSITLPWNSRPARVQPFCNSHVVATMNCAAKSNHSLALTNRRRALLNPHRITLQLICSPAISLDQ
jgi:hypothetical protein